MGIVTPLQRVTCSQSIRRHICPPVLVALSRWDRTVGTCKNAKRQWNADNSMPSGGNCNILTYVPLLSYKTSSVSHNSIRHAVQYKRPVATWPPPPMGVASLVYYLGPTLWVGQCMGLDHVHAWSVRPSHCVLGSQYMVTCIWILTASVPNFHLHFHLSLSLQCSNISC